MPPGAVRMGFPMRVVDVAFDAANPDDIYVAYEVGGLVCSRDNGVSWQSCNRSLLALSEQEHLKSQLQSDTDTEGMMDSHALTVSRPIPARWCLRTAWAFSKAATAVTVGARWVSDGSRP